MKAVMISIRPEWCEKVALGEKTVEVRKTRPKLEPPFRAYIYCTIGDGAKGDILPQSRVTCGKVIGEFVCDEIFQIRVFDNGGIQDYMFHKMERSCVPYDVIADYIRRGKTGCGWHISDLVIYDHPKELSEFRSYYARAYFGENGYPMPTREITRPPQSWFYVREVTT